MAMVNWMKDKTGKRSCFTAHHKIDNLIATIDWNGQQIDGPTREVMGLGDLRAKFESFGWLVMGNGR